MLITWLIVRYWSTLFRVLCLFFFFKQKTAYEMRISDWSSDVCSSDLGEQLGAAIDQAAGLGTTLAEVDQQLVEAADDLHELAGSLATRDEQLGRLVDD